MTKTFEQKIARLNQDPSADCFILADAKDPDMARGTASAGRSRDGKLRSINDLYQDIREIVASELVDIMLMSASTSAKLTIDERLFNGSSVTPAVRANDTTDLHVVRGGCYISSPSVPFSTATIDQIQSGKQAPSAQERKLGANLGLYSVTFNNIPSADLQTLERYNDFRLQAEAKGFDHFLEVFLPNVPPSVHGLSPENIPAFVNDHIVRMLAGVPKSARPLFLKLPYMGGAAVAELCNYDPSIIVGVLGGSAGTTHDAFHLVEDAKLHGARVALFGRKIIASEDQLLFIKHLKMIGDGEIKALEATKSYHAAITAKGLRPYRALEDDLQLTATVSSYAG